MNLGTRLERKKKWAAITPVDGTAFSRLVLEIGNRKSEAKSTGGHMVKTKKQGENSACSALFERAYYSSGYGNFNY